MSTDLEVLIVGASGVFGSRLAQLAAREPGVRLTLAGRRKEPLDRLAATLGASVQIVDRNDVQASELSRFDLVIDCAGPFQDSQTHLIEACLSAGVDYVDLADGRAFVGSIARFDSAATQAGVAVITGASSIPALSHAVLDELVYGWRSIESVRVGIFPGNRAPRGRAVVEAILSYVGKPVRVFTGGGWRNVPGWALQRRMNCGVAGKRWASVCDTPEQDLLVERYGPTQAAEFVAGLELGVLHLGLWLLSWPVRCGWVKSLRPAAPLLLWVAKQLRPLGSDRGAMLVEARGQDAAGQSVSATWTLEATTNRGPYVPVLAALAMIRRARDGLRPEPGAKPCSGLLTLSDFAPLLKALEIRHSLSRPAEAARPEPFAEAA